MAVVLPAPCNSRISGQVRSSMNRERVWADASEATNTKPTAISVRISTSRRVSMFQAGLKTYLYATTSSSGMLRRDANTAAGRRRNDRHQHRRRRHRGHQRHQDHHREERRRDDPEVEADV